MPPNGQSDNAYDEPLMGGKPKPNRPATPIKQDKSAAEHVGLQAVWDESMKGVGGIGLPHRKTAVLLISWEDELDDLKTAGEVNALEAVFTGLFRYTVVKQQLKAGSRPPQIQLSKFLCDFVWEYDDKSTLLIIYYAGHGIPGKKESGLLLAGNRQPKQATNEMNSVVWHFAENNIKLTKADVLVIFDCCFAGALAKKRSVADRSFEFLAACGSDDLTDRPGPTSFTSALIWSLKYLVNTKSSFTTQELVRKINEDAPQFPPHQHAHLMERGDDDTRCFRKLALAPLPKPGEEDSKAPAPEVKKPNQRIKHYLDLRFFYDNPPTKGEILHLAQSLKGMIDNENITARHIGWLKMTDIARNSIEKWRKMTMNKKELPWSESAPSGVDSISPNELTSPINPFTPPPSDYGQNDTSIESTPDSALGNVGTMSVKKIGTLNVNTTDISTTRLRGMRIIGRAERYRLRIFIVGLVVLLLECFHRIRPREAPVIVMLCFCGYAWWMTTRFAHKKSKGGSTEISSYVPLLVGCISFFICSRLLLSGGIVA